MVYAIFVSGMLIRILGAGRPLLGNFATKGVTYAAIARNFISDPATVICPTLNLLVDSKPSLHMTEWPFISYLVGAIAGISSWLNIDMIGRLTCVILYMISAFFLYRLLKYMIGKHVAYYSLIFYVFFPLGIIYGQSFQLEAAVMFCITGAMLNIYLWKHGKRNYTRGITIWLFISLLLLMKIQLVCLALPAIFFLAGSSSGRDILKRPKTYIFALACLVLPVMWYLHTFQVAQNYSNVFFSIPYTVKIHSFPDPRIFSLDFYTVIFKTLAKETFSPVGMILVIAGLFYIKQSSLETRCLVFGYLIAMMAYFLLLPRKVYEMNYYFMPLLFPGAILAAYGILAVKNRIIFKSILILFCLVSFLIAFNPSFKTPDNEKGFIKAADIVKGCIPNDAKIIVTSDGCPAALFYYIGKYGWTIPAQGISYTDKEIAARKELSLNIETDPIRLLEGYRREGAQYYICDDVRYLRRTNSAMYSYIKSKYSVVVEDCVFIVKL